MIEILPNFHPILVHFTVALFSVSTVLFVVLELAGRRLPEYLQLQWTTVARWNLWLGAGASIFTVLAGIHAFNSVEHDAASHAAMADHRNWATATFILFMLLAGWNALRTRAGRSHGKTFVPLLLAAQLMLLSTAWRGGELVYRYGLGVLSLPQAEDAAHDRRHQESGDHSHSTTTKLTAGGPSGDVRHDAEEAYGRDGDHAHEQPHEH